MLPSPLLQAVGTADTTQLSPAVAKGGHRAEGVGQKGVGLRGVEQRGMESYCL